MTSLWPRIEPLLAHVQKPARYIGCEDGAQTPEVDQIRAHAEKGEAEAQNTMGLACRNGRGVPQDFAQALAWFQKSAEQGNAAAQRNLGLMYAEGKGAIVSASRSILYAHRDNNYEGKDWRHALAAAVADMRREVASIL